MTLTYMASSPVKDLEDWLLGKIKTVLPSSVYVIIGHTAGQEDPVPYDFIRVLYSGCSTSINEEYISIYFNFQIYFSVHLPGTILIHRPALELAEKVRKVLWQAIPPRPSNAYPLLLRSEKVQGTDCNCAPVYVQEWAAYGRITNLLVPYGDPCVGENEPDIYIPVPDDYVRPLDMYWYIAINPDFVATAAITNGDNQPMLFDPITGLWSCNLNYTSKLPIIWGNLPFILKRFIKKIDVNISPNISSYNNSSSECKALTIAQKTEVIVTSE